MGALSGYTIIELAGIGPAPMGGMMLADMGAEVIRIERPGAADPKVAEPISGRNKKSVVLDLKQEGGRNALMALIEKADALIDPYRPGVCEKLGFGPDECLARNSALGVRAHDRMGAGGSARAGCGPRSQLHCDYRCAPCDRSAGRAACRATEPGR